QVEKEKLRSLRALRIIAAPEIQFGKKKATPKTGGPAFRFGLSDGPCDHEQPSTMQAVATPSTNPTSTPSSNPASMPASTQASSRDEFKWCYEGDVPAGVDVVRAYVNAVDAAWSTSHVKVPTGPTTRPSTTTAPTTAAGPTSRTSSATSPVTTTAPVTMPA